MTNFAVFVDGLADLDDIKNLAPEIRTAAIRAVNKTARDQRTEAARRIGAQVNLPKRSLGPSAGNLTVTRQATRTKLEAAITARGRPTSLARFARGSSGRGVTVEVKPGQATYLRRAFLVKLPQGAAQTETRFNQGLAIRLRPGESIRNKYKQVRLDRNVVLLYGPSIQQVFLDNQGKGVADDLSDPTAAKLEEEFLRLLRVKV